MEIYDNESLESGAQGRGMVKAGQNYMFGEKSTFCSS